MTLNLTLNGTPADGPWTITPSENHNGHTLNFTGSLADITVVQYPAGAMITYTAHTPYYAVSQSRSYTYRGETISEHFVIDFEYSQSGTVGVIGEMYYSGILTIDFAARTSNKILRDSSGKILRSSSGTILRDS